MTSFLRSSLVAVALGVAACSASTNDAVSDGELTTTDYRLSGVAETLLVADDRGHASLIHLGDPTTVAPLEGVRGAAVVAGRSFEGRFWLVDANGALSIVDASGASSTRPLGLTAPADLEVERADSAWLTSGARLVHVDPTNGSTRATIDLTPYALEGGEVTARGIKRVGGQLFVQLARRKTREQRGAIAVIELATAKLDRVIELEVPAEGGATEIGYAPGGAMVVDAAHGKLLVTAQGFRPSNTGMVLRIDLAQTRLDPWLFRSGAGFQGGLAPGADGKDLYIGYHTSTPVASTHLFHYRIAADGELTSADAGALLDAFEVVDDYPTTATASLFALPITCPAGFCLGGKGVSFIDTRTAKPHPRLGEATLGLGASFVLFL